jgi:beta-glucanase (GH16 family)
MAVRFVQANNTGLAWYMILPQQNQRKVADYTTLKFDEFNTDGAPDPSKWTYDLGTGDGGWGNGEAQTYTSSDNVIVAGGNLKITAKKVGSGYTSSRLKSEGKYKFTYGKVEVRAKLTTRWRNMARMLVQIMPNTWPGCGEIDIMEHKGSAQCYSWYFALSRAFRRKCRWK